MSLSSFFLVLGLAAQGTPLLAPGDPRVDGLRVHPHTLCYFRYRVLLNSPGGASAYREGTLADAVRLVPWRGDTVILQTREAVTYDGDTIIDTLVVDRRSLVPLMERSHWTLPPQSIRHPHREWSRRGTDIQGVRVSHVGTIAEETFDTIMSKPAFLEGTEVLLLEALRDPQFVRFPFNVSMLSYDEGHMRFNEGEDPVRPKGFAQFPERGGTRASVVQFGSTTYWLSADSLAVLQWEEGMGEGDFVWRFVLANSGRPVGECLNLGGSLIRMPGAAKPPR